ncbi:MAG: prolipoprotein diacylglyceryl transferase, partial [Alphaproteobacteria bacterium]|nr:prolipoprotein diacylglyceryl transferase [Alphaproteobacteria bacterium]
MLTLTYPAIDPVLIEIGPFAIRWYALSYIAGILLAWRYMIWLARRSPAGITKEHVDDFVVWATLGIVLGGRLGYVIFYKAGYYLQNPLEALAVWQGGMSFHGGLLGVIFAVWLFCRRRGYSWIAV